MRPIQVEINGVSHTFEEWAKIAGLDVWTIKSRYYHLGLSGAALIAPLKTSKPKKQISIGNPTHTFEEWAKITGIKYNTLLERYKHGATAAEFLKPTRKWERRK